MLAPEWRFQDLRSAHIDNLPTPHRLNWYRLWAVLCAAGAIAMAHFALTDKPSYGFVAVGAALATFGYIYMAREAAAQLSSPPTASFDELTEGAQAGADGLEGVVKVGASGRDGVYDIAAGLVADLATKLSKRRKPGRVARWQAATSRDLLATERPIVICQAVLMPHGWWRRSLMWLSVGLALTWMFKVGLFTVTDQRLLFHRRRRFGRGREPYRLHVSDHLAELEVLEWFQGSFSDARCQVLVLRCSDGRSVRFNIGKVWEEEGQLAFEVVASHSQRLPRFLAARWTLSRETRPAGFEPATSRSGGGRSIH
jgi:hypothetical protein